MIVQVTENKGVSQDTSFLCNQYDNESANIEINLPALFVNQTYLYFLICKSPDKTVNQYSVPLLLREGGDLNFVVNSTLSSKKGYWEFCLVIKEASGNLVAVTNYWTGVVKSGIASEDELAEQVEDSNLKLANKSMLEAEVLRVIAEEQRDINEFARIATETGRVNAETLRATAETNRVDAETSRATNENNRVNAETLRAAAEQGRVTTEQGRTNAEGTRVTAEENRVTAETARITAENTRKSNETNRENAEGIRVTNETSREAAETIRRSDESIRSDKETARQQAEAIRETNETTRQSNESLRIDAEVLRVAAEQARVNAEGIRVTAEQERATTEDNRATAEQARINAEALRVMDEQTRAAFYDGFNAALGEKSDESDFVNHLIDPMPHQAKDLLNEKTFRFGLQMSPDGQPQIIYEEVI